MIDFQLDAQDAHSSARAGSLETDHGSIQTPIFMPVGTLGSVKAVHFRELKEDIKAQIILGNTYHLYLRPGLEILEKAGGLHQFTTWDRPILTDSGGYQVFSLADNRKIKEEGVTFQSHIDGSYHTFTPESAVDIQRSIGADIMMAFDECPPWPADEHYVRDSMHLTHRWLDRCLNQFQQTEAQYGYQQALFPICQGGTHPHLRKASCEYIAEKDLPGNAIGGLSVGEPHELLYEMTALSCAHLPQEKPRYLMGVGTPENLLECIGLGVDMFDCVMPTRNGRNGMVFTTQGIMNMRNKKWEADFDALDPGLGSYPGHTFSKAYLRHLITSKEVLGLQICSLQNLSFYLWMVAEARKHILKGDFLTWKERMAPVFMQRL